MSGFRATGNVFLGQRVRTVTHVIRYIQQKNLRSGVLEKPVNPQYPCWLEDTFMHRRFRNKGSNHRENYRTSYVALHRMFDHLLSIPADRPGRTLKDGLYPESHRADSRLLTYHELAGAIERDHNHAKLGRRRVRQYKIGE